MAQNNPYKNITSQRDSWLGSFLSAGLNLVGSLISNESNADQAHANRMLALNTARNSIRWKAADLRAAGLNPVLAANSALGGSAPSIPASIPQTNSLAGASEILAKATSDSADRSLKSQQLAQEGQRIGIQGQSVKSQGELNAAVAAKENSEATLNAAKTQAVINQEARDGDMHDPKMKALQAQVDAQNANTALANNQAEKEAALAIMAEIEAQHKDLMLQVQRRYTEVQITNVNADTLWKKQQISASEANLALAKIASNLNRIRTESDLEKINAEVHYLYRRAFNGKLESDLLRWQRGAKLEPEREQFLNQASRITNLLSDAAPLILMWHPATRLLGVGWQGLRWLGSAFGKKPIRAGLSHGSYGDHGMTIPRMNGNPWYSVEHHNW